MTRHSTVRNFSFGCVFAFSFLVSIQAEIGDSENALTIQWYDNITAELVEVDCRVGPTKHLAENTKLYTKIKGSLFLEGTDFASEYPYSTFWQPSPGFVDTIFYSYQKHHNLIIRPDDVWTAIMVQFSLYVNANAGALRHSLVNFNGKRRLSVRFFEPVNRLYINIFIDSILRLIVDYTHPWICSWITPNFTTTTQNDKLTAGAALMATVQNYFEFNLELILCGIPKVTILGDVNDWKDIRQRVVKLKEFELNGQDIMHSWSTMLVRILDEFVRVKDGFKRDADFWRQAIRIDYSSVDRECTQIDKAHLNGWITAFSAFDTSGNWNGGRKIGNSAEWLRIATDKITPGVVHVPIQIYDEHARPEQRYYNGAIIAGHMGHAVKFDELTLQPLSGWAMVITGTPPDYLTSTRSPLQDYPLVID